MADVNTIIIGGKPYDRREGLQLTPLTSLFTTGNVAGTRISYDFSTFTEKTVIQEQACKEGGYPVIIGLILAVRQVISVPLVAAGTGDVRSASFMERRADDLISFRPGDAAAQWYQMARNGANSDRVSEFMDRVARFIAPLSLAAAKMYCPDFVESGPRVRVDGTTQGYSGATDDGTVLSGKFRGSTLDTQPQRGVYPGITAAFSEPADDTAYADHIFIPFTFDGCVLPSDTKGVGYGPEDAGVLYKDAFSDSRRVLVDYTPNNRTSLYDPTFAAQGGTFGTFEVRPYILWRVADLKKPVTVGRVWRWNRGAFTVIGGEQNVDAGTVQNAVFGGWLPVVNRDDANRVFASGVDAGNAAYDPEMKFIYPPINPAQNLYTQGSLLEVGDGTNVEWPPLSNPNNTFGWQLFLRWNFTNYERMEFHSFVAKECGFDELRMYGPSNQRASTTSQFCAFTCLTGAAAPGAVAYPVINTAALGNANTSFSVQIGLDGTIFPIIWCQSWSAGAPGIGFRAVGDTRTLKLVPKGGFVLPTLPNSATAWPADVIAFGPYLSDVNRNPCDSTTHDALPVSAVENNADNTFGRTVSLTMQVVPGVVATLKA